MAVMKRAVSAVGLVCVLMVGCMVIPTARAAGIDADIVTADTGTEVISFEELSLETVSTMTISRGQAGSMTRATSRIEWEISSDTVMKADTAYSLEADEIVTICTDCKNYFFRH